MAVPQVGDVDPGAVSARRGGRLPHAEVRKRRRPGIAGDRPTHDVAHRAEEPDAGIRADDLLRKCADGARPVRILVGDDPHRQIEPAPVRPGSAEDQIGPTQQQPRDAQGPRRRGASDHLGAATGRQPGRVRRDMDDGIGAHLASVAVHA
ncbi:MAG: hypothetical protein JSS88_09360 [Actinobacteria bacterium]|nr:hypothetical protein [Actinomycetota bacterium]